MYVRGPSLRSDVRSGLREVASAAGSALLALGKELPWVAPIAFLIGGVVQAAMDVQELKVRGTLHSFIIGRFFRNFQAVKKKNFVSK
jgi:hypothetical protein